MKSVTKHAPAVAVGVAAIFAAGGLLYFLSDNEYAQKIRMGLGGR